MAGNGGRRGEQRPSRQEGGERKGKLQQKSDEERRLENSEQERVVVERALGVLLECEAERRREREEPERGTVGAAGAREDATAEADDDHGQAEREDERAVEITVPGLLEQVLAPLVVRLREAVGDAVRGEGARGDEPERQQPGEPGARPVHARVQFVSQVGKTT